MKTYRAVKRRMQSRFIHNGKLDAKLFMVSSKKSEQDFIESYIETVKDAEDVLVVDEPQWNVKPEGTFSKERFKVAVGDKRLKSRVCNDDDDIDALVKQGYRIIDVPLELKRDFIRDVDSSLMEFAGISASLTSKFIAYEQLAESYSKTRKNPFQNAIISLGMYDDLQIQDFFSPELVDPIIASKPHFISIDGSLTGDKTGISDVAIMGAVESNSYVNGEIIPVKELRYAHVFSVSIQCPNGSEISFEKTRKFIYYLKYNLGWNIQIISMDGFQSASSLQQFKQAGFDARLTSVDRSDAPYLYFKQSINEKRISMLHIEHLEEELINLERNNMSGKVDHPVNGSKDAADSLCAALFNASNYKDDFIMNLAGDYEVISDTNYMPPTTSNGKMDIVNSPSIGVKESKSMQDEFANAFLSTSYEQEQRIKELEKKKISDLRSKLSGIESAMVSDDELSHAAFCGNDDIIIF